MRGILTGLMALVLAGCTPPEPPSEAERAATCVAAFQRYDRILQTAQPNLFASPAILKFDNDRRLLAESALRQNRCITFSDDVPDLEAAKIRFADLRAGESGVRQNAGLMHVGVVTSEETAKALEQFFAGMGYRVRTIGAKRLGRRIYIGPLMSRGEVIAATELVEALGFPSSYLTKSIPSTR